MKTFTLQANCSICGAAGTTFELEEKYWNPQTTTIADMGVVDHRCDTCRTENGEFNALVADVAKCFGDDTEAERFVIDYRTATKVAEELTKDQRFIDSSLAFTNEIINQAKMNLTLQKGGTIEI